MSHCLLPEAAPNAVTQDRPSLGRGAQTDCARVPDSRHTDEASRVPQIAGTVRPAVGYHLSWLDIKPDDRGYAGDS